MKIIALLSLLLLTLKMPDEVDGNIFPEGFLFGSATASYQVEGGWDADGKGENIWDRLLHTEPNFTVDHSNGDVACDSYHKFKEDIAMLKYVGFDFYRFSLSWSRILPTGESTFINQAGVDYYMKLIDGLLANGIQPMVTLYHWDLPQKLQDLGGWTNPIIVGYFLEYARTAFGLFGSKVKWWITINEPFEITRGYGSDAYAPNLQLSGTANYLAGHNLLKSHAVAYRLYKKIFKSKQRGKVSFSLSGTFSLPKSNGTEDIEAAEIRNQFTFGWFGHPVYSENGDYPKIMRQIIDKNSKQEGRLWSRLPTFTSEEVDFIKGTYDFLGLNHYTSALTEMGEAGANPSWERDTGTVISFDPAWPGSASSWLKVVPEGFQETLNWIKKEYNNTPVFVTENGYSDFNGTQDADRIKYYKKYMKSMARAINQDGCDVIGYTMWSLMDNLEWQRGYSERFGIYEVNFEDTNRTRTPKKSAEFIKYFLKNVKEKQ